MFERMTEDDERGCGERKPGCYLEVGLSPWGTPLNTFLLDPPQKVSQEMIKALPNKTQVMEYHGEHHVMRWVGEESYPFVADVIEEGRRMGFSFRIPANLDTSKLVIGTSRIIVAHPKAYNTLWERQYAPEFCKKEVEGHALRLDRSRSNEGLIEVEDVLTQSPVAGPCLFKTYELIPKEEAEGSWCDEFGYERYWRRIGSTTYLFTPSGEDTQGLVPGFFARLPLTNLAFVDGNMGEEDRKKWQKARDKAKEAGLPHYTVEITPGGKEVQIDE